MSLFVAPVAQGRAHSTSHCHKLIIVYQVMMMKEEEEEEQGRKGFTFLILIRRHTH